jgi:hypothetical protein
MKLSTKAASAFRTKELGASDNILERNSLKIIPLFRIVFYLALQSGYKLTSM